MGFQSQNFSDFFTKGFVVGEFKHNSDHRANVDPNLS